MKIFDIVIIGGGTIGMLAALSALRAGKTVALIDQRTIANTPIGDETPFDVRVSAITPHSQQYLERLGIWEKLFRKTAYDQVLITDAETNQTLRLPSEKKSALPLGHIVEQSIFQHALLIELKKLGCMFYSETNPEALISSKDQITLYLPDRITISASLCIAADGARSWVREQMGIAIKHHNYHQTAIIGTLTTEYPHENIARQCFLQTGPIAFLPLSDAPTVSLVWTLPAKTAQQFQNETSWTALENALYESFSTLGKIQIVGKPYFFPLHRQHADKYINQRVILIGDAAHVVHPLAGWGLNLGIEDVATLEPIIQMCPIISTQMLRQWERKQRAFQTLHMHLIDTVTWLFDKLPSTWRSMGFDAIDRLKCVQRYILAIAGKV